MEKKTLIGLLWAIVAIMVLNAAISGYVYYEKHQILSGKQVSDICFASTTQGSCSDVQFSEYGTIFGVSVGLWGLIAFSFMTLVVGSLAWSLQYKTPIRTESELNFTRKFCLFAFTIAIIGALYFIGIQDFVLHSWCKYCLAIDTLTILSGAAYIATFKKAISFFLI